MDPITELFTVPEEQSPFALAAAGEIRQMLETHMDRLTGLQREVVELHYFDRLSFASIAKRRRVSEFSVERMHSRALKNLRKLFAAAHVSARDVLR